MRRYKYPAPFDPPDPGPIEVRNAPKPPEPPFYSPPLPVDIPVEKSVPVRRPSLYRDLFGDDLSVIFEAYGAPWASKEQQILAGQLLEGQKSINSLSTQDLALLDDMAVRFNDQGGEVHETVPAAHGERLSLSDDREDGEREDEEMQPSGGSDLQSDSPSNIAGAYGWLSGDGEGGGK